MLVCDVDIVGVYSSLGYLGFSCWLLKCVLVKCYFDFMVLSYWFLICYICDKCKCGLYFVLMVLFLY